MATQRQLFSSGSSFETELAYSRAVVQGDWCFVSGITGYDYETMSLANGMEAQAETCFQTLGRVLDEAGFRMSDIVRVQYTITNRNNVNVLAPVLRRHLSEICPAATMVVAGLIVPEMLFEVEATAFRQ